MSTTTSSSGDATSSKKDILFIGWDPYSLDPAGFPAGMTADKIQEGIDATLDAAKKENYSAVPLMLAVSLDPAQFADKIKEALQKSQYKVVAIGNGVRSFPKYMLYFEARINAILGAADKDTKVAFNTMPHDTIEAVKRWI